MFTSKLYRKLFMKNCRCVNHLEKSCSLCNKIVSICKYRVEKFKYCSMSCRAKATTNRLKSYWESKRIKRTCAQCNQEFNVPKYRELKAKYCSRKCEWGGIVRFGDRNNLWKGGITAESRLIRSKVEYKKWRNTVFKRDDYTCTLCGARSGNGKAVVLNADHIKPFSIFKELRFNIENGRTLCVPCHRKTDTYGRRGVYV